MTEQFKNEQPIDTVVGDFETTYAFNLKNFRRKSKNVSNLFDIYLHERDALFAATAAYISLPKDICERKRLIDAIKMSDYGEKMPNYFGRGISALRIFLENQEKVRKRIGADWRNVLSRILAEEGVATDENKGMDMVQYFSPKHEESLDTIMTYIPFSSPKPDKASLIRLIDDGEEHRLIRKEQAARLRAYLQEFILGPKQKKPRY